MCTIKTQPIPPSWNSPTKKAIPPGKFISHLMGFIYKSLLMMEVGIRPIWVFDGIPPEQKKKELVRRKLLKQAAKHLEEEAKEVGDINEQQ